MYAKLLKGKIGFEPLVAGCSPCGDGAGAIICGPCYDDGNGA